MPNLFEQQSQPQISPEMLRQLLNPQSQVPAMQQQMQQGLQGQSQPDWPSMLPGGPSTPTQLNPLGGMGAGGLPPAQQPGFWHRFLMGLHGGGAGQNSQNNAAPNASGPAQNPILQILHGALQGGQQAMGGPQQNSQQGLLQLLTQLLQGGGRGQ